MFSESRRRHKKKKKIEMERTVWKVLAQCLSERNNSLWERNLVREWTTI